MVSYLLDSDEKFDFYAKVVCGKPAHFKFGEDMWYCADCWDYLIAWNREQHERWGVPLIK